MKFGDTIIRNLTESDIEQTLVNEHMHAKQDEDDKERSNK
jgi:hypothetical protein